MRLEEASDRVSGLALSSAGREMTPYLTLAFFPADKPAISRNGLRGVFKDRVVALMGERRDGEGGMKALMNGCCRRMTQKKKKRRRRKLLLRLCLFRSKLVLALGGIGKAEVKYATSLEEPQDCLRGATNICSALAPFAYDDSTVLSLETFWLRREVEKYNCKEEGAFAAVLGAKHGVNSHTTTQSGEKKLALTQRPRHHAL